MNPYPLHCRIPSQRARGATLVVGMVLLLLMTVLSLTTLKSIKTDERLAGNLQDRNTALQAAESALREAEEFLTGVSPGRFANEKGLYLYTYSGIPAPLELTDDDAITYQGSLTGVAQEPLYTLEQMESGVEKGQSLVLGVRYGGERRATYRITALGFGGSATTRVALQSTYKR